MTNSLYEITFLSVLCNWEKRTLSREILWAGCEQRIMNFELIFYSVKCSWKCSQIYKHTCILYSYMQVFTLTHSQKYTGTHTLVWHRFHINWGSNPISSFKQLSGLHGVTCTPNTLCALTHTHTQNTREHGASINAQDTFAFKWNAKVTVQLSRAVYCVGKASQIT